MVSIRNVDGPDKRFTKNIFYKAGGYMPTYEYECLDCKYRFEEFPLIVGLDIKPFFEFSTRQIFRLYLPDIAFALKYRF